MDIIFHAHNAVISDRLRARAEAAVHKLAARLNRAVDAVVRVETDGPTRRVEILLRAARRRSLVAEGRARNYGPALTSAARAMSVQLEHRKRTPKGRARSAVRG